MSLLAGGGRGRVSVRDTPPPAAVRPDRPRGGVRRAALPVGAGHEAGSQHEPGAALGDPKPPRCAYLDRWYREHEQRHNDGVNRLVVRFAREGVEVVAGWRGEVNVPNLTQVRPDLLAPVSEGALGGGTHYIEFERTAVRPDRVAEKLGPYRRMAAAGRPLPLLMVCETALGRRNFRAAAGTLPMLTAIQERAFAGPVTGPVTVWSRDGVPAALHCR